MKPVNKNRLAVNGLFNNEQHVIDNNRLNHFFKAIIIVVTLSVATIFSKPIQDALISKYNQGIAFVQQKNSSKIMPLGV